MGNKPEIPRAESNEGKWKLVRKDGLTVHVSGIEADVTVARESSGGESANRRTAEADQLTITRDIARIATVSRMGPSTIEDIPPLGVGLEN